MKSKVNFLIHLMIALLVAGCKKDKEYERSIEKVGNIDKVVEMKSEIELHATWDNLGKKIDENPVLWTDMKQVYSLDAKLTMPSTSQATLRQLYNLIQDPNANPAAAKKALEFFVKVDAKEVVREALINPRKDVPGWDLVIIASEAARVTVDIKATPYLIYAIAKNNYLQEGSENATIHKIMKRKLIEAIKEIHGLDIKITEINVNDPEQINKVLSMAKTWAKQKGIKLFEENKKDNK